MIELYLLIQVGSVIGGFNTIVLVIISGFLGAWLARMEGMNTLMRVRTSMQQGIMPTEDLLDALIIFLAGGGIDHTGAAHRCHGSFAVMAGNP